MPHLQGPGVPRGLAAPSRVLLRVCPFARRFVSSRGLTRALLPDLPRYVNPDSFLGAAGAPQSPTSRPGHRAGSLHIAALRMLSSEQSSSRPSVLGPSQPLVGLVVALSRAVCPSLHQCPWLGSHLGSVSLQGDGAASQGAVEQLTQGRAHPALLGSVQTPQAPTSLAPLWRPGQGTCTCWRQSNDQHCDPCLAKSWSSPGQLTILLPAVPGDVVPSSCPTRLVIAGLAFPVPNKKAFLKIRPHLRSLLVRHKCPQPQGKPAPGTDQPCRRTRGW